MKNNCACFTPNEGRIDDIVRLAREYHVDGVIDANLKFCTLYDTEKSAVAKALEAEGIPCLGLETTIPTTTPNSCARASRRSWKCLAKV